METPKITTAQQIKDIIEPIPANLFQVNDYGLVSLDSFIGGTNNGSEDNGQSCFLGHIHRHFDPSDPKAHGDYMGYGARQLTQRFLSEKHGLKGVDGTRVNNYNNINGYNEPEIKDRVMHMINDMIEAGY